jgi:hypothetical protein
VAPRLEPLTRASIGRAPGVCVDCVFWQSRGLRNPAKERWAARMEEDWGGWGTLYWDGDRLLGFLQAGPADAFPRSVELPAGPPSSDAVLVTCGYVADPSAPWVLQSLLLAAIGEARDRDVRAIEAFAYRYPEGTPYDHRFLAHRTIFPSDFLADLGFHTVRSEGRVELARLDLRGLVRVEPEEGVLEWAWGQVRKLLSPPEPVPDRP